MKGLRSAALFCFCFLLVPFFVASALTVLNLTEQEMAVNAETILVGKVLSAYSERGSDGYIETYITVRAEDYIKGKVRQRNITLKTLGGVVGDRMEIIPGAPDFYRDEEVMLFLETREDGSYFPLGMSLGKYSIYRDAETGRKVVVRDADGNGRYFSSPREEVIENLSPGEKVYLNEFYTRIQRMTK